MRDKYCWCTVYTVGQCNMRMCWALEFLRILSSNVKKISKQNYTSKLNCQCSRWEAGEGLCPCCSTSVSLGSIIHLAVSNWKKRQKTMQLAFVFQKVHLYLFWMDWFRTCKLTVFIVNQVIHVNPKSINVHCFYCAVFAQAKVNYEGEWLSVGCK